MKDTGYLLGGSLIILGGTIFVIDLTKLPAELTFPLSLILMGMYWMIYAGIHLWQIEKESRSDESQEG